MLNHFRRFSHSWLTKILLLILIASFGMWGIGDMIGHFGQNQSIATVGKKKISFNEFARALNAEQERLQRQLGTSYSEALFDQLQVPEFVLRRMVQGHLLEQEVDRIGMRPDDRSVAEEIRKNPLFTSEDNSFDKKRFDNMLRAQGMSEKSYVEQLRMQMASDRMVDAVSLNLPLNDALFAQMEAAHAQGRNITLYNIGSESIPAIAPPSDADLQAFQKAHAERFSIPEMRKVSLIQFSAISLKATAKPVTDEAIKTYYDAHPEQFHVDEKREVEQLLYNDEEQAREGYALVKSGKTFKQAAEATHPLNQKNLSLGLVDRKGMLEAESEHVFALKEGEYTDPVKSPFGWHIFRVVRLVPAGQQPLDEVRASIRKGLEQEASESALTERLNQMEDTLAAGSTLEETATTMGLKVTTVSAFDKAGNAVNGKLNSEIPMLDKFLEMSFKTEEKTTSPIVTANSGNYYVLRVDAVMPEKLKPFAEIKEALLQAYTDDRRAGLKAEAAAAIEADLSEQKEPKAPKDIIAKHKLATLATGAVFRGSKLLGNTPLPTALLDKLFASQLGALTPPIRTHTGDYLLATVESVSKEKNPEKAPKLLQKDVLKDMQEEMLTQYMHYLQTQYPVDIRKDTLDRIARNTGDATP